MALLTAVPAAVLVAASFARGREGTDQPRVPVTTTRGDDTPDGATRVLLSLTIRVSEPSGKTRTATLQCGGGNKATGYLEETYYACTTAFGRSPAAFEYLRTGALPEACQPRPEHAGHRAVMTGRLWVGDDSEYVDIDRDLMVDDACDEALWHEMLPLLAPKSA